MSQFFQSIDAIGSMPRTINYGIKDESVVPLIPEAISVPQHLPLFYLKTVRGVMTPQLVNGGDGVRIYGVDTFTERTKFFTHQTLAAKLTLAAGNACFIKRVDIGQTIAGLTLTATVNKSTQLFEYARNSDNTVILDVNGAPTFTTVPVTNGIQLTYNWVPNSTFVRDPINAPGIMDFSPTGPDNNKTYPLLTFFAESPGAFGNDIGVRLWCQTSISTTPPDLDVINDQEAYQFAAQLVERTPNSTTDIVQTIGGNQTVNFMFLPNAFNFKTDQDLAISRMITDYEDDGILSGTSSTFAPLSNLTVHDGVVTLMEELFAAEVIASPEIIPTMYMINFLTGIDVNGVHNYSFQVNRNGALCSEGRTAYLQEGSDGDLSDVAYINAVGDELDNGWNVTAYPLMDLARYPLSVFYDTGFPLKTKIKFFQWLNRRPDVYILGCTYIDGENPLTPDEEESVSAYLQSQVSLYSESVYYGTPVCRAAFFGQSGKRITGTYKKEASLLFETITKIANYMGSGDGVLKSKQGYDLNPNNIVRTFKEISSTYINPSIKRQLWGNGVNYLQSYDLFAYFCPGFHTVYPIQNSVLTGLVTMQICVDIQKQAEATWRDMTGRSDLTPAQFADESNRVFNSKVAGRYDNRVIVIPLTFFTAADNARGYSWEFTAQVYANVEETVDTINLVTRRMSQLPLLIGA